MKQRRCLTPARLKLALGESGDCDFGHFELGCTKVNCHAIRDEGFCVEEYWLIELALRSEFRGPSAWLRFRDKLSLRAGDVELLC